MSINIAGSVSGVGADVQTDTSLLVAQKPFNPGGTGGYFQMGLSSNTMAAGLTSASPVFSFRYTGSLVCCVRRVRVSLGDLVGFTAGFLNFNMFVARAFTASDSSGTAATLTGNNGKLRTSFSNATGVGDFRISSTAALSAGTRTLDAQQCAQLALSAITTAGQPMTNNAPDLFYKQPGEYPLGLANNEGFVIQATVPATGTWQIGVDVSWDELASF